MDHNPTERAVQQPVPVAVVGATGYTGAELLRLLIGHPAARLERVCGHGKAGQPIADVLPSFTGILDGDVARFDADDVASAARVAFCALPHAASAPIVDALRERDVVVFDLSADYRLRDLEVYRAWYGDHGAPARIEEAVYGLVELHREALRSANLVAVPGCYPTAAILALAPLLRSGLVQLDGIVVDAKTGASGAGRAARANTHLPEASEGIRAYKSGGQHRHVPEMEQELTAIAGTPLALTFTPHLVPMTRGILATAYTMATGVEVSADRCVAAARELYAGSPSVVVLDPGRDPDTLWVRGSNRVLLSYQREQRTGRILAQAAIDNLVKGAAGQALQAFNVRFGLDEGLGLQSPGAWP